MIRFLTVLALFSLTTPVLAADDGGFGTQRFSSQTPAALSDDPDSNPATIEPAAGTDTPATPDDQGETVDVTPEPTTAPDAEAEPQPAQ